MLSLTQGAIFSCLTALIVIAGDLVIKYAADTDRTAYSLPMIAGYIIYASAALTWYAAMRDIGLGEGGVFYSMFSLLALCALGALFFGETIDTRQMVGIGFALAAIALMAAPA